MTGGALTRGSRVTHHDAPATVIDVTDDGALIVLDDRAAADASGAAVLLVGARVPVSELRVPLDLEQMARDVRGDMAEAREELADLSAAVDARLATLATSGARGIVPGDWLEVIGVVVDAAAPLVPAARALPLAGRARELVHGLADALEAIRRAAP